MIRVRPVAESDAVFFAEDSAGRVLGLAELSIRPTAEGCRTSRVAYLDAGLWGRKRAPRVWAAL